MKKSQNKIDDLYFPWDKNASDQENMMVKEDPEYYKVNFKEYFDFLSQFPPSPEELKEVEKYKKPFTLPE
jgi:hypothetical protein